MTTQYTIILLRQYDIQNKLNVIFIIKFDT